MASCLSSALAKLAKNCYSLDMPELDIKQLITENFLRWQTREGEIKTLRQFAEDLLGIHEVTLNRIYNGHRPASKNMLIVLAEKTGDPRFYDYGNIPRPDPDLERLKKIWEYLPEKDRRSLAEQAERYAAKNQKATGADKRLSEAPS
jgi:hypothetical protein